MHQLKKLPPALRHAAFSATTILPGESVEAFERLHKELIAEFIPEGPCEKDIVADMAHLLWRKQNLGTFRIAEVARRRCAEIELEVRGTPFDEMAKAAWVDPAVEARESRQCLQRKTDELGEAYALVELGDTATHEGLMKELEVQDRLDTMIQRCTKRLLMVRGIKSLSAPPPSKSVRQIAAE
jgi:hypothetical protein